MNPEFAVLKRELRETLRARVKELSLPDKTHLSEITRALLFQQNEWRSARSILFYAGLADEIDVSPLIEEGLRAGKIVALPRYAADSRNYDIRVIRDFKTDCMAGKFGILEPLSHCPSLPLNQLDLALVPGVGFDASGHRLGRGQGFYDRLLADINGIKCGVAFDQQLVEHIPREAHDVLMNFLLTPTRWLKIS